MVVFDQANALRRLVENSRGNDGENGSRARICTIVGGKSTVGVTTLAVNMAAALASQGERVLLVDADPGGGNAEFHCGLEPSDGLSDVLSGERCLSESIRKGPGGFHVLASLWTNDTLGGASGKTLDALIATLRESGNLFDTILVDAGTGLNRVVRRFWRGSDAILLVTTPDLTAVMDGYATIKVNRTASIPLAATVNFCNDDSKAAEVFSRLAHACRRFLSLDLTYAGRIKKDGHLAESARKRVPYLLGETDETVGEQLTQLAGMVQTLASYHVDTSNECAKVARTA